MNNPQQDSQRELILLRILWMLVFTCARKIAELVLAGVVVLQLGYRLFYTAPSAKLAELWRQPQSVHRADRSFWHLQ